MNRELIRDALLILTQDGKAQGNWPLNKEATTIGRWEDNDVVIADRWISRHHAEIRREGTRYVLHDLGSKNGLYVNGQRWTRPLALEDGDQIQIAPRCMLAFVDSEATAPVFQEQGGVKVDESACRVWVQGQELDPPLSSAQFTLLVTLVNQPGQVFTRDELIARVWADEDPEWVSDEALNSLVRRLRKRLMDVDPDHRYIFAVRGHGFRFEQPR
jgi:DNA-binding response OmpR family regulator